VQTICFAAAALFLASKTNYDSRFLFDVVQCFHTWRKAKNVEKVQKLLKNTKAAVYHMNEVKDAELKLAQFLEFDFEYKQPFAVYGRFIASNLPLRKKCKSNGLHKDFMSFLHSPMMSPICVIFSPEAICAAGMHLGYQRFRMRNKNTDFLLPKDWMKKVDPYMDNELLEYLSQEILAVTAGPLKVGMSFGWDFTDSKIMKHDFAKGKHRGKQRSDNKKRSRGMSFQEPKASPSVFPTPSPASQNCKFPERTLYFTNVSSDLTEEELASEFKQVAPVKMLNILKRGDHNFGFVEFLNKNDMYATLDAFNGKLIKGRKIRLEISRAKTQRSNPPKQHRSQNKRKLLIQRAPPSKHTPSRSNSKGVFVGLLPRKSAGHSSPFAMEELSEVLEKAMSKFGKVAKVHVNQNLRDGFVYFEEQDAKERALIEGTFKLQRDVKILSVIRRLDDDPASSHAVKVIPKDKNDYHNWNSVTPWDLAASFLHFGVISEATLVDNKNYWNDGLRYSHGIVRFHDRYGQENALACGSNWQDLCMEVNPKRQAGNLAPVRIPVRLTRIYEVRQTGETSVYIENLPNTLDQQALKIHVFEAVQKFGKLVDISIEASASNSSPRLVQSLSSSQSIKVAKKQEVSPKTRAIVTFKEADCQKKALHSGEIMVNNSSHKVTRFRDITIIRAELTVAVHNIPEHFTEAELRKAMEKFGEVEQCILRDKKKFAYSNVRFDKRECALKAIHSGILSCGENDKHTLVIKPFYHMPQGRTLHIENIPTLLNLDELEQTIIELIMSAPSIETYDNDKSAHSDGKLKDDLKRSSLKRVAPEVKDDIVYQPSNKKYRVGSPPSTIESEEPPKKKRRLDITLNMKVDDIDSSDEEGALPDDDQDHEQWTRDYIEGGELPLQASKTDEVLPKSITEKATHKVRYSPQEVGMIGINCYDGKHANLIFENQRQAEIAYAALKNRVVRTKKLEVQFHIPLFHRRMLGEVDGERFRIMVIGPNLPISVSKKMIDMKCSAYGVVEKIYVKKNTEKQTQSAFVIFEHHDEAARAIAAVNDREIMGSVWHASFCMDNQGDANKSKSKGQSKKADNPGGKDRQKKLTRGQNKSTGATHKKLQSPRSGHRHRQSHSKFRTLPKQYVKNQLNFSQSLQQAWGPQQQHHSYEEQLQNYNQGRSRQSHNSQRSIHLQRTHNMGSNKKPNRQGQRVKNGPRLSQY